MDEQKAEGSEIEKPRPGVISYETFKRILICIGENYDHTTPEIISEMLENVQVYGIPEEEVKE